MRGKPSSPPSQEVVDRLVEQARQYEVQRVRREALDIAVDLAKQGAVAPSNMLQFAEKIEKYLNNRTT